VLVVAAGCFFEPKRPASNAQSDAQSDAASDAPNVLHCNNAIQDGNETGIDCGGSCPTSCPGATCSGSADCVTGSCVSGFCELASGPPSWLPGPTLQAAVGYLQCAVDANGVIFAVGGTSNLIWSGITAGVEVLTPGATDWTSSPSQSLNTPRAFHAVAAVNETVFAYGGLTPNGVSPQALSSIEVYGGTGTWSTKTPDSVTNYSIAAAGGIDGKLYVVAADATHIYSPTLDSWSSVAAPPDPRNGIAVARGSDGVIYAFGGSDQTVAGLDPQLLTWQSRTMLGKPRVYPGAATAPDGRIYAIGGDLAGLPTVEAYTPSANRWTAVASLTTARSGHGAAVGPDGRIYAIGGASPASAALGLAIASVEVYGPVLALDANAGMPGTTVTVTATNFAVNAPLAVTFNGTPLAAATSDALGHAVARFTVPSMPAGSYTVTAVDDKSQYPVQQSFQIQ
jgi:hypothetical protein